jgi:hypothetical protein
MLFAALDYYNYRRESGRYSRDAGDDIMCGAFKESLPDILVCSLEPGDPIVSGNFGWWVAWLIMYLTSSQISHIALYAGNRKIIHQTLGGPVYGSIEDLFGSSERLLAIKMPPLKDGGQKKVLGPSSIPNIAKNPYPTGLVIEKGLQILTGRDGHRFRVKFLADAILIITLISSPLLIISTWAVVYLCCGYLAVVAVNLIISHFRPPPADEKHGAPCDALWVFPQIGGIPLVDHSTTWFKRNVSQSCS